MQLERFLLMSILAGLSGLALIGAVFWQIHAGAASGTEISARNTAPIGTERASTPFDTVNWQAPLEASLQTGGNDPDGLSNIGENVVGALVGSYAALAQSGGYSAKSGAEVAEDIAQSLRATISYPTFTSADLKTDTDTSHARMLVYRADMRVALEPLLKNKEYELSNFALYIETSDKKYVDSLKRAAENYREAIDSAAKVAVPRDAIAQHVEILNALSEFGATLEKMARHGDDAFAAVALLRTYDDAERRMFNSFDALARYSNQKQS